MDLATRAYELLRSRARVEALAYARVHRHGSAPERAYARVCEDEVAALNARVRALEAITHDFTITSDVFRSALGEKIIEPS